MVSSLKVTVLSGLAALVMSCATVQHKRVLNYDTDNDGTPDVHVEMVGPSYEVRDSDNDRQDDLEISVYCGDVYIDKRVRGKLYWSLVDKGPDGTVDYMMRWTYGAEGQWTRTDTYFNSDGSPHEIYTREHDLEGRLVRGTHDKDADGHPEEMRLFDHRENSTERTLIFDKNSDGTVDEKIVIEHVGSYRPCLLRSIGNDCLYESGVRMTKDKDGDGCPETTWSREGDTETVVSDYDSDCEPDSIEKMYYDPKGICTKGEWDYYGDGTPNTVAVYEDERVTFTYDEDNDGKPDEVAVHLFDDDGIYRKEIDEGADGTVDNVWRRGRGWSEE